MPDLPILVFDVNETLLDIESIAPHFQRIFGDAGVMRLWFAQVILYSEALTLVGDYADFGALGGAVLTMLGHIKGCPVTDEDRAAVKEAVATMPPHPEVPDALRTLADHGFRLATLTNNPLATCVRQLEAARIDSVFERMFSIDDGARRYKPAPDSYIAVADAFGVAPNRLCLIACHAWDTLGAGAAGLSTALITRPGNAPIGLGPKPDITGSDLRVVAAALVARYAA